MPSLRDSGKIGGSPISIRELASGCDMAFPLSLRQFMETPGCPFTHCNRLHIKVLTSPNIAIGTMLNHMREVFTTAGIGVVVASRENLTAAVLGNATFNNLNALDVGPCTENAVTAEQTQLFQNQNGVPAGQRNNEVVVYFVQSVLRGGNAINGCAAFPADQPGVVVSQIAPEWTLAHEVGHVLGLDHIAGEHTACPATNLQCCSTPDFTRLMTGCGTGNINGIPTLDASEIDTMTGSDLNRPC